MPCRPVFAVFAAVLIALIDSGAAAQQDDMDLAKFEWIKIRPIGDQDKTLPTLWVAPAPFPVASQGFNQLIVLPPRSYEALTRSPPKRAPGAPPLAYGFGTSQLSESFVGEIIFFSDMDRRGTCDYLAQIRILPGVDVLSEDLKPVVTLMRRLGC